MVGCGIKADSLSVVSVNNVSVGKISGSQAKLNFDFTVENTSSSKMTIKAIDLKVVDKDDIGVLALEVNDPLVINKKSQTNISAPVTVKFQGLLGLLGVGAKLRSPENLFVSGTVKYKIGCLGGTYKVPKTSLKQLMGKDGEKLMGKFSL